MGRGQAVGDRLCVLGEQAVCLCVGGQATRGRLCVCVGGQAVCLCVVCVLGAGCVLACWGAVCLHVVCVRVGGLCVCMLCCGCTAEQAYRGLRPFQELLLGCGLLPPGGLLSLYFQCVLSHHPRF